MNEKIADIAVVGAGIVGLAFATIAAESGKRVVLFERDQVALGASIRNFGLIWPVGQAADGLYNRALRSRTKWLQISEAAKIPIKKCGSVHLAHHEDEWNVLNEFADLYSAYNIPVELFKVTKADKYSPAINTNGLYGGVYSPTECTVDPRVAIRNIPYWLQDEYGVRLRFWSNVREVDTGRVVTDSEYWRVDHVYVCSGNDFQTLFPEQFSNSGITRCKLQMMRSDPYPTQIGPTLCGGLTLRHYAAFEKCKSLMKVKERYSNESPWFDEWGIHVMVTQNNETELVIGDSHEYGLALDPFDHINVDQQILSYLSTFAQLPDLKIAQHWNGTYPKLNGKTEFIHHPVEGVTIVNGLGGAGMTLSFGLAEEVFDLNANSSY